MQQVQDIAIVVSCHKPFACPKSGLYVPMHVGAEGAACSIAGAQPDNEGDNISNRNFTFCELTGQYWAWKNMDAAYVGQCHYRRYFVFDGKHRIANDHEQIEAPLLDACAVQAFCLDNDDLLRSSILAADAIVPRSWDVRYTCTPAGVKRTVRDHMVGYGLVTHESLERLESLVCAMAPEYASYVTRYLDGSRYLGYNCFVLRRDLFDKLCAFEFPILLEFDRTFDYECIPPIQKRVCGFLGEILFSSFIMRLEIEESVRVRHVPLVFFEHTEPDELEDSCNLEPGCHSLGDILIPKGSARRVWLGKVLNRLRCER